MCTRKLAIVICLLTASARAEFGAHLAPELGTPAPDAYESVVMPDGTGLPDGRGNVAEGAIIWQRTCLACHGADGRQSGNELVGGSLADPVPLRTVGSYWPWATTLFDYIARAMPYGNERSLTVDEIYAVTAWILFQNGIVDADATLHRGNLADVEMPNRDGFFAAEGYLGRMP